jgi:uncharacterized protein YjbJ (UPF0337 family)
MNHEQFKQSWYQLEGHLKKHWGKLTEEDLVQIDGDLDTSTAPSNSVMAR